jgi:glycerol-3-phosphate dehydrogenase
MNNEDGHQEGARRHGLFSGATRLLYGSAVAGRGGGPQNGSMKRAVAALREEAFDLAVLGGGITGAGVALDAVLRGFRVALIDRGDFASGTSSVSSKLVHGGLRYLEHGEFHLVYEALRERRRLLHNAPHLVHPLRFVIPFREGDRVAPWKWRLGLGLYDLLAGFGNLRRSRRLRRHELRGKFPALRGEGLLGGAEYRDAQMDDARLCLEVVRTAVRYGARAANYVEAVGFEQRDGRIAAVRVVDRVGGEEFLLRARLVLNATGPWVDAVCRLAGDVSGPHLRPTKGVHLVLSDLGLRSAFLLLHPADGRVFFVLPWCPVGPPGSGSTRTLIGTTDTLCEEPPDALTVTPQETEYLLRGYRHYFDAGPGAGDVISSFAGLRPLIRARPGEPSALTREFRVFESPPGLLSVAGGKYTTYRHMAEVITDEVASRLGRRRRCRTRHLPLDATPEALWDEFAPREVAFLRGRYALGEASAWNLVRRYGRLCRDVAAYLDRDTELARPVMEGEPELRAEFAYQREHEMAVYPADHLLRRTRLGLFRSELLRKG